MTLVLDTMLAEGNRGSENQRNKENQASDKSVEAARVLLTDLALLDSIPCAKLKLDELLFEFLSSQTNQAAIHSLIKDYENGVDITDVTSSSSHGCSSPVLSSPRRSKLSTGNHQPFSPPRSPRSGGGLQPLSPSSPGSPRILMKSLGLKRSPRGMHTPNSSSGKEVLLSATIPKFYGVKEPIDPAEIRAFEEDVDRYYEGVEPDEGVSMNDFVSICKDICNFPTFFNGPLCRRIRHTWDEKQTQRVGKEGKAQHTNTSDRERKSSEDEEEDDLQITKEEFLDFWRNEMLPYDDGDRFFRLLKQPNADVVVPSDFLPFMEELLAYHPGLEFLESTPEFQEKYARTVIARILYEVNTTLSGRISRRELRQSDLLKVCHQVDEEEDINLVLRYFSYEHFYTLYVKFWELDTDHDFLLSKEDIMRHGGHSLTPAIVERIFQQPVYRFFSGVKDKMGYEDFVIFFLAEEDKTNPVSIRYWFKCVDLDGDGVIRSWEMRYFYNQQLSRLQSYGHEIIPFVDVLCQAHDFVHPRLEGQLVIADFLDKRCIHISGTLFNILFNLNKFIAFEQRDPYWIRQQHEHPELTEWDRFAASEYARLATAEEEREMEEESFSTWADNDGIGGSGKGRNGSWLQFNESPF